MPTLFTRMASTTLAASLLALSMTRTSTGANVCMEQPNQQPVDGAHWYYHLDRANQRKCWYLGATGFKVSSTEMLPVQPSPVPMPVVDSLFSALFGGNASAVSAQSSQDATTHQPRIIQANPTKLLRIDDVVQSGQPRFPEERAEQPRARLSRAQHDALFQKFIQWYETRNISGKPTTGKPTSQSP
jgi:hypothetical protein